MNRSNQPSFVYQYINMHKGDKNVCWEWTGPLNKKDGRPYFTVKGKRRPAYAYVIETCTGIPQKEDEVIRHSCDNPICCNPDHLSFGSHQDNMNDMKERDRHGLPKTVIRAIRKLLSENKTHGEIAKLYGVSRETITAINNKRAHADK